MALASLAPMKIGRVRRAPEVSWRRSTGVFDGNSTRTAARCISTMGPTLPRVQVLNMRVGVGSEGGQIARHHHRQVPVAAGEVEPVAEDEFVGHFESHEA